MHITRSTRQILSLFLLNCFMFFCHIVNGCKSIYYFCQLTIISQTLVVINFGLSLFLHERKSTLKIKLFLSRLHLVTVALEGIVVIGFWGLRIFFTKGIIKQGVQRDMIDEILSLYVHGGSLITMLYFIKTDQIIMEDRRSKKFIFHLFWGIPYIGIQYLHWAMTETHVYGFLVHFDWVQLIVFEAFLYFLAVSIDYSLTIRHGYKLSLRQIIQSQKISIEDLEKKKAHREAQDQIKQQTAKLKKRRKSL